MATVNTEVRNSYNKEFFITKLNNKYSKTNFFLKIWNSCAEQNGNPGYLS